MSLATTAYRKRSDQIDNDLKRGRITPEQYKNLVGLNQDAWRQGLADENSIGHFSKEIKDAVFVSAWKQALVSYPANIYSTVILAYADLADIERTAGTITK